MGTATEVKPFTPKDYRADIHNDWCPGCGDFGILSSIQMALAKLQVPPHRTAVVSGIGCSGKTPHYMNTYAFHTLHGRVMPCITALKLANHDLTVLGVGGDGDAYGIGGGHFVAGGRRNLDITYVVFNNDVYALTKGQASPTIAKGLKTKSMPEESIMEAINPVLLGLACGYTFVARGYALDTKYLVDLIAQAIQHRGSALVDVLQTCPTYNDLHSKTWYAGEVEGQPRLYKLEETGYDPLVHDPANVGEITQKKAQALLKSQDPAGRIALGVYYKLEVPTYGDILKEKITALDAKPLVEIDEIYHRDITPNLKKMM
jgi:2-oxoglutarate ferredoxin oxidoreductase subunit beta